MEVFKIVAKVKYKDNLYYVLVSKSCQMYFIKELEDGSIIYPNEDEFKELYSIFTNKKALASLKFDRNYRIIPKVIMKNGKMILATMLVLITGCTVGSQDVNSITPQIELTEIGNQTAPVEDRLKDSGFDFHSLYNYEDQRIYRIHIYINKKSQKRIIECQDFQEFGKYINTKINPSYEDVKQTIINNENIDEKYKKWLLEGLENLEKNMPNLNLTVLNFNMSRLELLKITQEELNQLSDVKTLAGLFDPDTGKAYFIETDDEESNKFILFHEVLGHGISEANFEYDVNDRQNPNIKKERIECSTSMLVMRVIRNSLSVTGEQEEYMYIGEGFCEGLADQIAKYALNDKTIKGHPYIESSEQLRIMSETVGLGLEEYIGNGGTELLSQKMQQQDVDNSLIYILSNDAYVSSMKNSKLDLLSERESFKANILNFFYDFSDDKIARGMSKKVLIKKFTRTLLEGGEYIHSTFDGEEINYKEFGTELEQID